MSSDESNDEEPKTKRTLTCEKISMDDISCMKCDEDCPDARSLQCGHMYCLECIHDEAKHSPSPEAIPCPICRSITTMPSGGWDQLSKETPGNNENANADFSNQNGDEDFLGYDIEAEIAAQGEIEAEVGAQGEIETEVDAQGEIEEDDKVTNDDKEIDEQEGEKNHEEKGEVLKHEKKNELEVSKKNAETENNENQNTKQATDIAQENVSNTNNVCPKHKEPLIKNRCKTCRTVEARWKKMEKTVGNKVQICDGLFQDINHIQTAIHTGMDKLKEEISERSRHLVAEIQRLEQQELERLQQHREQRVERLRECGQTLMEVAKGIRDELAVVQDKVEGTDDSVFNESFKELRKACSRKIPHPDQKLKLIAFVAGKEDKLGEIFGKIDEKPKE